MPALSNLGIIPLPLPLCSKCSKVVIIKMALCVTIYSILLIFTTAYHHEADCHDMKSEYTPKVLILGAGMSGIGVAEGLSRVGFNNFLLLEGRDRVGGRIRNSKIGNTVVSLGAGWIHEIGDINPIWKMAEKFNISYHLDNYYDVVVRNGNTGKVIPGSRKEHDRILKYVKASFSLGKKRAAENLGNPPFLNTIAMVGWKANTLLEKAMQYYIFDFENGIGAEESSSIAMGWTGEGTDVIVTDQRGYEIIPDILSKQFHNKIHFNTIIKSIDYTGSMIEVTTSNGNIYTADYVVLTFSSGVINSKTVKFNPLLPTWKLDAYELVPLSHYCKFFMQFPYNFWDDSNYILFANQFKDDYVHFQSFDRPTLAPGKHILLATLTGERCQRGELMTDEEFVTDVMKKLRKIYGAQIPAPIELTRSNWSNDPFTYGSYSNPSPGTTEDLYDVLQAPVQKRLWFAGEATSSGDLYGYVHGAYISGLERAETLWKCIKFGKCPEHPKDGKN